MLLPGSQVGPYEIIELLGAGGMGEVFRARDGRIGREIAIKMIRPGFAADAERVRRFEQEARAAGVLNHPNLLTVFEFGTHEGVPYLATELLQGMTLRELLGGKKLPSRKAVDYAMQIASGLDAAHERGIIHRDLKPENIFVIAADRVKLLDFGLAKLTVEEESSGSDATVRQGTREGVTLGTAAYMSPEQVRGVPVDVRSDTFSFGIVLYEMLSGGNPFRRDTAAESMHAVLHDDPPSLDQAAGPALSNIVRHMLEKNPSQRFASAKDLSYALESWSLSESSSTSTARLKKKKPEAAPREAAFQRLTFRRGFIMSARFAGDGSVVYGAAWEDKPLELFASHPATPEPRPLGIADADILAVSSSGELAISLGRHYIGGYVTRGTLARVPMFGGVPRPLCENVQDADWSPDGRNLMITRVVDGIHRIEFPIGTIIYQTPTWISHARFSPKGNLIAFVEHELWGDDGGRVVVIDLAGRERLRSKTYWKTTGGIAWTPSGDELWVSGDVLGSDRSIHSVTMNGKEQRVLAIPGRMTLHDISKDGTVLIASELGRREAVAGRRSEAEERNISWFDWSWLVAVSSDGREVILEEQAAASRGTSVLYIRPTDGSPALRLGEGHGRGIPWSPDGRAICVMVDSPRPHLELWAIGPGETRQIRCNLDHVMWWQFYPDGTRLMILGNRQGEANHLFELPVDGDGEPRLISPAPISWPARLSQDGKSAVALSAAEGRIMLYDTSTGDERPLPGSGADDVPIQWSEDNQSIYLYRRGRISLDIDRLNVNSGERTKWITIHPADPAGILDIMPVVITPDGETYVYGYRRFLSDLYLVNGLA
ncbi:MAG TPA: protein kinase [Thermoanaerobaculia bacterium]|nr:protein kinase [Thermoanaerobaculia bacterium]